MSFRETGRRDWVMLAGIGAFLSLIPCLFNPRYYFIDDAQQEFMPAFYNIGRALREGSFPFITLTNWFGGNYLAEYQYALYNPVSLITYFLLPSINSLAVSATLLACFYQGMLAAGAVVLARNYGIGRPAAWLLAITLVTNNFIGYWFAAAWPPILIGTAWFMWAWASLLRAHESAGRWLISVGFAYLMLSAGSPHTDIVYALLTLILFVAALRRREAVKAISICTALLAALLLCMPSFIPVLTVMDITGRAREIYNQGFLIPNLYDLLALSSPFLQGYMHTYFYPLDSMVPHNGMLPVYTAFRRIGTPFFYCAWYIFPLLPFIAWRKIDWKKTSVGGLLCLTVLLLVASQGPDHLTVLMAPFRFVPYFHITAVLLFFLLLAQKKLHTQINARTITWSVILLSSSGIMALQKNPGAVLLIALGLAICAAGIFFFLHSRQHGEPMMFFILTLPTIILFIITHIYFPSNVDLVDWHFDPQRGKTPLTHRAYDSYTFYTGGAGNPNYPARLDEFQTGFMALETGIPQINGYSSIIHQPIAGFLCMTVFGETCAEVATPLFDRNALTGLRYVDLFRVDRIVAMRGPHLNALLPRLDDKWRRETDGRYTQTFVRTLPNAHLPGTVAWISGGMRLVAAARPEPMTEEYRLTQRAQDNDHVVFSRLWWPGYEAEYAGRKVSVRGEQGIFVTVDLPDDAPESGTLKLRYRPPHMPATIALFSLGLALCAGMTAYRRHSIVFFASLLSGKKPSLARWPYSSACS